MKIDWLLKCKCLQFFKSKKEEEGMAEKIYHFERLTPIDSVNLNVYEQAINYVFDNSDIKNVAISGSYSSGKSSLLASYKKKHKNLKFLHISLTHFKSLDDEENTEVKESELEGKILNQLLHQIPSKNIPQTNFRIKKKANKKNVIITTLVIVVFLIFVAYFCCFNLWKGYVNTFPDGCIKNILLYSIHPYTKMIMGIAFIILSFSIIYCLISAQNNKNIVRKFNFKGTEIEIFNNEEDSYFDKYLNEVLYLFENADADVIVFEDLDRFGANIIFERLHEVNRLANIHLKNENKKILRFFYLLRDDIFVSKDRTKFFDYIIPVVPVMDSSNCYDQFISLLRKGGIYDNFDDSFLQGVSLYIDDMRLLKNIYNEFVIYINRVNNTELNNNKMLAMIIYKNLFPRDFAELQLNQGFVYSLFNNKERFIEREKLKINETIKERIERINSSENECTETIRELNIIFYDKYSGVYRSFQNDNDLSDFLISHLNGTYKNEYIKRKRAVEDKLNKKNSDLKVEINKLKNDLTDLNNKQLHQIITRENIDEIFSITSINEIGEETSFNEIKSSEYFDLLKYLIRNGYIDETYADYMTYFYENSLSLNDKIFLRSVSDKKAKGYNYQLTNLSLIVDRLKLVDFDQEEVLNFQLLTYLLRTPLHNRYLERFLDQVKNTDNLKFVSEYFEATSDKSAFVKHLNLRWPEVFNEISKQDFIGDVLVREYSILSIYNSDNNTLKLINHNSALRDYISNTRNYLAISEPNIDKLISGFKTLGVVFAGFEYDSAYKDLYARVYEESLYEINEENLRLIQTEFLDASNEDIIHRNYTILHSHPEYPMTQYVEKNINEYFDVVLQICDGTIYDDEDVAIDALNNSGLTSEHKQSYISFLRTKITSINEVGDTTLWNSLLNEDIVQYSEDNVMSCFAELKLSKTVISYINRFDSDLDFSKNKYDENIKENFFDSIVICEDVNDLKYKQILTSLNFKYNKFNIDNISESKLNILVDEQIVKMTVENLKFIRTKYSSCKFRFIFKNIVKYIEIMTEDLFLQEELLEILTWDISDELKIKLLKFSDEEISIVGMQYTIPVYLYILSYNFSKSDLTELFQSYDKWDVSIQAKIFEVAEKNISSIIAAPSSVSNKLLDSLFHSTALSRNEKIDLLIALLPKLPHNYLKEILLLLDLDDYVSLFNNRSRPKIKVNEENKKLLTAFKEANLIENFNVNPDNTEYYKVSRCKSKAKF